MTKFASFWVPHRIQNEIRFSKYNCHISLLITMVDSFVLILWVIFLLIIILTLVKGVKVVHQGTFMIVEHFGEFSVGSVIMFCITLREH